MQTHVKFRKIYFSEMEAVFGLLYRDPTDTRTLLAAVGASSKYMDFAPLLKALADPALKFDCLSKAYLIAVRESLAATDLVEWPLSLLESILVNALPRWGSLIPRDSLSELFRVIHLIITRGLSVLAVKGVDSSSVPANISATVQRINGEILRILWYSSALNILLMVLKTNVGEDDDCVMNVLLHHNGDNDANRQSVVEAQEQALLCMGGLFGLVSGDVSESSMGQLATVLKRTGSDMSDSSSLPFAVSVCSFLFGGNKLKVRAETVDAAADCLRGLLEVCELSPSAFLGSARVRNLNEKIIAALVQAVKDRQSLACIRLLDTLLVRVPTVVVESKELVQLVQDFQCMYRSALPFIGDLGSVKLSESESMTSGKALALARHATSELGKIEKFMSTSIGNPDWLRSDVLLSAHSLSVISGFHALLQSMRIPLGWVLGNEDGCLVSEPTLNHLVWSLKDRASVEVGAVVSVNEELRAVESRLNLLQSIKLLLGQVSLERATVDLIQFSVFSVLVEVGVEAIREIPEILKELVNIVELLLRERVRKEGLEVVLPNTHSDEEGRKHKVILIHFLRNCLLFTRDARHRDLIVATAKLTPFYLKQSALDDGAEEHALYTDLAHYVSVEFALSEPALLSLADAFVSSGTAADASYALSLFTGFAKAAKHPTKPEAAIQLFSLVSSVVVLVEDFEEVKNIFPVLASHPLVRDCARAAAWDVAAGRYSVEHLLWIHALQLGVCLLSRGWCGGVEIFLSAFVPSMLDRLATAHTSDLASLEEACLVSRFLEMAVTTNPLPWFFQFTSLITSKPPSVFPRSRTEKLAAALLAVIDHDVSSPAIVPSAFTQRVVWLASDILSSTLRRISRQASNAFDEQALFHSLLDSCHFVFQYLKEMHVHRKSVILTTTLKDGGVNFVPLSVYLSLENSAVPQQVASAAPLTPRRKATSTSLLHSLPSPPLKPRQSLLDSLTPKNSPKGSPSSSGTTGRRKEVVFLPALVGDCTVRAGLSFIAPSLVTEEAYTGKLVEVMALCLIQALRLAGTEALMRPLIDLLMTMKAASDKLPSEAVELIGEVTDKASLRYETLTKQTRAVRKVPPAHSPSVPPALGPLGYAAIGRMAL